MESSSNPFAHLQQTLNVDGKEFKYFDLQGLNDARLATLPFSIRVLLESAIRNCDNFHIKRKIFLFDNTLFSF